MAGTCYLVYSGGTINLQDAPGMNFTYTPKSPNGADEFAMETATLRISKPTITQVGDAMGSISRAFDEAQNYNNYGGGTAPVYLYLQPAGYPDAWRSEIINANIIPMDGMMNSAIWEASGQKIIDFDMSFTRRNYFEGTLGTVYHMNPNGTGDFGLVRVSAFNDGRGTIGAAFGKRYNYYDIPGTSVLGNVQTPARLLIGGGSFGTVNVHLAVGGTLDYRTTFEAEDRTIEGVYTQVGTTTLPYASNGTVLGSGTITVASPSGDEYMAYAGRLFQVYARVAAISGTVTPSLHASLCDSTSGTSIASLKEMVSTPITKTTLGTVWQSLDLGAIYLPANYNPDFTASQNPHRICCFSDTAIQWDVIQILPNDQRITLSLQPGLGTIIGYLVDPYRQSYIGNFSAGTLNHSGYVFANVKGNLNLTPGINQRIYIMDTQEMSYTGTALINAADYIVINYRPRRLTI